MNTRTNVADRLSAMARLQPNAAAIAEPVRSGTGRNRYRTVSFAELEADTNRIASGLVAHGVRPGMRIALLVRPGIDFVACVFGLLKTGAVQILIDPGMGKRNLLRCLAEAEPEGFVAISPVHAVLSLVGRRFPKADLRVTVGRRWFWGGPTLDQLRRTSSPQFEPADTKASDPASIIFTTGSTGPPKGVLYHHEVFDRQAAEIQARYGIQAGEVDLPGFPLFGLFNAAMGVTTIIPEMDPSRPAQLDPEKFVAAIHDWNVTQSFGSPAIWNRVGRYCEARNIRLPTLRRVLSAGAPVPPHVLERMKACMADGGEMFTPYGATEALPVASISSNEVLGETAAKSKTGAGVCVGSRFSGIEWKVIRIVDGPIPTRAEIEELPSGEIGELIVTGAVVTHKYVTRPDANPLAKIDDGDRIWHRMGDVGYFDEQQRFWYCGRMAHRVQTASGTLFTEPCEGIFNMHPAVYRSALVGVGPPGQQTPVMVVELWPEKRGADRSRMLEELRSLGNSNPITSEIELFLFHSAMPVDIRHNAKIFREKLAVWAGQKLAAGNPVVSK
jgi:acyl-CoA synthetase (AMP-forming)/AMP-acid ligase II